MIANRCRESHVERPHREPLNFLQSNHVRQRAFQTNALLMWSGAQTVEYLKETNSENHSIANFTYDTQLRLEHKGFRHR